MMGAPLDPASVRAPLPGSNPSQVRSRQFANIIDSFARMDRALASADEILRDIKENHLARS